MALLPTTRRFIVEEFPDQKSWIGKLLLPLNEFLISVISAFNNGLTFSQNMSAQVSTFQVVTEATVTAGAGGLPGYVALQEEVSFKSITKSSPIGVFVIRVSEVAVNPSVIHYGNTVDWELIDGQVVIHAVSGLEPSKTYNVTCIAITG